MKVWKFIKKWFLILVVFFFASTICTTLIYKFLPVYVTPLMVIRCGEQLVAGEKMILHHRWVPLEKISKYLPQAVIASEDNLFMTHNGFDIKELKKAIKENETRKHKRGASTISQQTAKNVFLWPSRTMIRKGFEVYFTFLIEIIWGKERIMEVYLNSIEMGKGIYGAQAVAKHKFNTTAAKLSWNQCAMIAAVLPNPIRFHVERPSSYILGRQSRISYLMRMIGPVDFRGEKPKNEKK
ncbi:MAG: monofunctional biosynthetic peptidoglycan transglycosylase [Bacteroidales bacterium]|nr:monofunctional biosynthetic peptidoglycan transglycosylase [Bacteroidales bacterium]MDD4670146.1 monofunctional biosynthetic peptidoglycan transglycosylase [Bacteroidales bacterium]